MCYSVPYQVFDIEAEQEETVARRPRVEVQAAAVASFVSVCDREEETVLAAMSGWRVSVFWHMSRWVALGAQLEELTEQDQQTRLITPIKHQTQAALVKWTLTPDTEPKVYALLGLGRGRYRSKFPLRSQTLDAKSTVLLAGLGIDMHIWKGLHAVGEYQLQFDTNRWQNFALTATPDRHHFSAGLAYCF